MINFLAGTVGIALVYLYFCGISVDPQVGAQIYSQSSSPKYTMTDVSDPTFSFFGYGALFWTLLLIGLAGFNDRFCSFNIDDWISSKLLFAAATITVSAKILVGPVAVVRKSLCISSGNTYSRPLHYWLYDLIMIYPLNLVTGIVWKLTYVAFAGFLVFLLSLFGWHNSSSTSIVPLPLFMASAFMCLGRVAGLVIHLKIPHRYQLLAYGTTVASVATVSSLLEQALKSCGAQSGMLPNYKELISGVLGLPPLELLIGIVGVSFGLLVSKLTH